MLNFLIWYLTLTLLGWLTFPLVYRLFPALTDRGYSLARTFGLLVWGYAFWMLASLGIAQNNIGGILFGLAILGGLSVWLTRTVNGLQSTVNWIKENLRLVFTIEALFFIAFAFMAFIRAANPDATGTEKPMELAFINAILRSPTLPPNDPWLSGYSISYYHFGYILTAMIAKITATAGSVAFNLMIALVFALAAIGSFGILYNLLAKDENHASRITSHALLAPLFLLLIANLEGFLEVLRQRGVLLTSNFWAWLNIKDLVNAPQQTGWVPERFWWWWRASRVVQDYDLVGNFREVIDEFPFFSFLLGDLHPHVLSLPFVLLAVAVALNIFLGGWRGKTNIIITELSISKTGVFITALVLGGLAFLNTWDILIAAALVSAAYTLHRVHKFGWRWLHLEDFLLFGFVSGIAAILLYLPFYLGFSSQAGGILPNLINPTRGAHLWIMFGTLLPPIFFWMIYLWRAKKQTINWKFGFALAVGLPLALWLFSWLLGWLATITQADFSTFFLQSQGVENFGDLFRLASLRRVDYLGSLVTLSLLLFSATAFLTGTSRLESDAEAPSSAHRSSSFILLLVFLGTLLVIAPEFVYLRDQFGSRMNTIFKFYYQAWILWSLAAAYGTATLLRNLRGAWDWAFRIFIAILIIAGLSYPVLSLPTKTNNFVPPSGLTLDSAAYIARSNPEEANAITWLQSAPDGIIVEAVGGSYTGYARISTNTGLQTVLGWPGHESQWRGGGEEIGSRQADIETLYTSSDWVTAQMIIDTYSIRYIYVGHLERTTYFVDEGKFERFLEPVFNQGSVTIYEVP